MSRHRRHVGGHTPTWPPRHCSLDLKRPICKKQIDASFYVLVHCCNIFHFLLQFPKQITQNFSLIPNRKKSVNLHAAACILYNSSL